MSILSVLLVPLGLSMDNLAVTVAAGSRGPLSWKYTGWVSIVFSLAHIAMFSGGWLLGAGVGHYIGTVAPWLACIILVFVGVHMLYAAIMGQAQRPSQQHLSGSVLLGLALATSVDAWLAGMGLALTHTPFVWTVLLLGLSVWIASWLGFYAGAWLGEKFGRPMEALGGLILMGLGVKLLLEGLGIL
ncbi:MAG: manganese efflux pump [Elusimicrobiaceae bacterium]|nr:manganese efflux pump [Elusimicrobiaceae bacterium]